MTHSDEVTLGGQTFYTMGPVRGNSVAEWTTGLKVGKATWDEREHAFFIVLDDFSGGVGYRRLDIREAMGTVWDNAGGADLRRARHVTLPPLQTVAAITAPPSLDYTARVGVGPSPIVNSTVSGSRVLYLGFGGSIYSSTNNGSTLSKVKDISTAYMISRILDFTESPSGTRYLFAFCEGGAGTARYQKSTDGATFTDGGAYATKVIEDAIVWSQRIIGTAPIARIIYSFDGLEWSDDTTGVTFDAVDTVWAAGFGRVHFVGVFMAPWGEPAVYFLATNPATGLVNLFVLDFYGRTAYPVEEVGNARSLSDAIIWNGQIILTDSYGVWAYDGSTTRDIGFHTKYGLPTSLYQAAIQKIIGGTDYLYAIVLNTSNQSQILCYNGAGWAPLGPAVATFASQVGAICTKPGTIVADRQIVMLGSESYSAKTTCRNMTLPLPKIGETPTNTVDSFHASASFRTGWIDGGFADIKGALYKLRCAAFGLSSNEKVTVGYRLDDNESASFTTLGSFTAVGQTLYFAAPTGLEFLSIQFEVSLARGSTATLTPELVSLILTYDKKPELRTTWTLRVDVNRMIQDAVTIDGNAATTARVWTKLKSLWNTKTLLAFTVPNVETGTLYVKIADMPLTLDDFRTAVKGQGYAEIQVLEPIVA